MKIKQPLRSIRRGLLGLLPEFIWPAYVNLDGVDIPVRNMPFSCGIKKYLVDGNYENAERQLVNNHVRKGDVVVDMGCSIGVVSALISNKIGETGRLLSIEASPIIASQTAGWFEQEGLGNATVVNGFAFPVWDTSRLPTMAFVTGNGSLGGKVISAPTERHHQNSKIISLSDSIRLLGRNPDVLVCDIEGSEKILLEHTVPFPATLRTIIIELHPTLYGNEVKDTIVKKIKLCGFDLSEKAEEVYCFSRSRYA